MKPFDSSTSRLDLLHSTHLANVAQMPRGNIYHVIQSFNSYMAFARQLSGLELAALSDKWSVDSAAQTGGGSLPVCPVASLARNADRSNTQLHGLIFKDHKRLRRKEDLAKFQEFLRGNACCSEHNSPYWKMVLNEPMDLEDFTALDYDQVNILRVCILVQHKLELNTASPELMLLQCRKLQTQNNPRRREENNKFLFKRFFKWVQKDASLSPRAAFDAFRTTTLGGLFSDEDVEEFFKVVRDTPTAFGGKKVAMDRAYHVPNKINAEFEAKLLGIPRFREALLGYMRDVLPEQARQELKDNGIRYMFRFYLILKEIDLNAFSSALSNHVFTKKCKAPWTISEVNEIIVDMTARIQSIQRREKAEDLASTLDQSPLPTPSSASEFPDDLTRDGRDD